MKQLIILPFAEIDIKETVSYFSEISQELEHSFIQEIDISFREIRSTPLAFPIMKYDIRKFVMVKFPFCIYFIDRQEALYILSVFHDNRNPKEWQRRRLKKE